MANSDAWRAPDGSVFVRRRAGQKGGPRGHARIIAEPAYRRLLAAEPLLQAFDPDADRHLPGGRGGGALPVAAQLARRYRAQRQGDAGAVGRRTGQRDDADAGGKRRRGRGEPRRPRTHRRSRRHGRPFRAGRHRRQLQGHRRFAERRAMARQVARRPDFVRPAAVHVRRAGRRHGREHRRPGLLRGDRHHRPAHRRGRRADLRRATCSPTGAAPCRSTSRCSCLPRRSC